MKTFTATKLNLYALSQLGIDYAQEEGKTFTISDEDYDTLSDITNHGADCGFTGFTYYSDTCEFTFKHWEEIWELAQEQASSSGTATVSEFISGFNCVTSTPFEVEEAMHEVITNLPEGWQEVDTEVPNALAWFALEETARNITDQVEG